MPGQSQPPTAADQRVADTDAETDADAGGDGGADEATTDAAELLEEMGDTSLGEWYHQRQFAQNIREGQPYFNGPSRVPAPERYSPSQLLQCHRKQVYRQCNAPKETEDPTGIFWVGERIEEKLVIPYLQTLTDAVDAEVYVRNSMWIDAAVDVEGTSVRLKGATDPVLVDRESKPLVVTEVKSKQSLDHVDGPSDRHRAQVHVYMHGLSEKYNREVQEAVILYVGRESLAMQAYTIRFDAEFWEEAVLKWASQHTKYRAQGQLPPADPEQDWECGYCPYQHRCGESDHPYSDEPPQGLLPLVADYPREQVETYLKAHADDDEELTPTLAREYPELATEYPVRDWECPRCEMAYEWSEVKWSVGDSEPSEPPLCPACVADDELVPLQVE